MNAKMIDVKRNLECDFALPPAQIGPSFICDGADSSPALAPTSMKSGATAFRIMAMVGRWS